MAMCLNKSVENELRALPGNNLCCDCDGKMPQWASVSFGVFMCLECSGRHRALGVHISFVRSVSMDSWSDKQIAMMRAGGNDKCNAFLNQYGVGKTTMIAQKYNAPAALLYRDRLSAEVEGRPLPTQLPSPQGGSSNGSSTKSVSSTVAQGTDPLPGETEAQYVARQRQLQEEARERMRQKFGGSSGLSSGGRMQGIGSDPGYDPSRGSQGGGGIDYAEASKQAYGYLQAGYGFLGETVSKVTAPSPDGGSNKLWSNAMDLWSKATVAASEAVNNLVNNDEDDGRFPRAEELRFPRPEGSTPTPSSGKQYVGISSDSLAAGNLNNSSENSRSNSRNSNSNGSRNSSRKAAAAESWDDLDDEPETPPAGRQQQQQSRGIAYDESEAVNHTASRVAALKVSEPSRLPAAGSRGSLASNHNSVDNLADQSGGSPNKAFGSGNSGSSGRLNSSGSSAGGHVKPTAAPSPVGDDFFANFGV